MSDDELGFVCPHCIRPAKYVAEMTLGEILSLRHNSPHQAVEIDVLKMEINHKANRIAELEAALKPFADAADDIEHGDKDSYNLWEHPAAMSITIGDLRNCQRMLDGSTIE